MTKLSPRMQELLEKISEQSAKLKATEIDANAEAQRMILEAVQPQRYALSVLLNEGDALGIPRTRMSSVIGTRDYRTFLSVLSLAENDARVVEVREVFAEEVETLQGGAEYRMDGDLLVVTYSAHGPRKITGSAEFNVIKPVGGEGDPFLVAETPLWDETFTVRNDVVAILDGHTDNEYYDEAIAWLHEAGVI